MKKIILFATAVLLILANAAMADSIAGMFGITVRGGIVYTFDNKFTDDFVSNNGLTDNKMKLGTGWAAGGGLIYGITDNLAVNFDVIYTQSKAEYTSYDIGTGKTVDFALGAQWRFMPKNKFVPYVGAGLDVFWNQFSPDQNFQTLTVADAKTDVDVTYGAHVSGGADFFFTPNIALNAEIRGVYSTDGNLKGHDTNTVIAKYNPSNISGFLGIAFYFGGKKEEPAQEIKKVAQAAPVVEQKIIEKGRAELKVEFDSGKATVKQNYYNDIESIADVMKKYPDLKIVIEGHTDNILGEDYNLKLSQRRAEAVKQIMVSKYNIDSSRITAKGFGYSKPIAGNETKEGRQQNRRIEAAVEYIIKK